MKTTTRKVQPQWIVKSDKSEPMSFMQKEVNNIEFSEIGEVYAAASLSPQHEKVVLGMLNQQFAIRCNSQEVVRQLIGDEKPKEGETLVEFKIRTAKEHREDWETGPAMTVDFSKMLDQLVEDARTTKVKKVTIRVTAEDYAKRLSYVERWDSFTAEQKGKVVTALALAGLDALSTQKEVKDLFLSSYEKIIEVDLPF